VTIWKTGTILLLPTQQLLPKTESRRNALVSLEKKRMANEFARPQSIGLSCVGRDAGFKYREGS